MIPIDRIIGISANEVSKILEFTKKWFNWPYLILEFFLNLKNISSYFEPT